MKYRPRHETPIVTLRGTTSPRLTIHIEATNGLDTRPLCQQEALTGWTDAYEVRQRLFSEVTCRDCRTIFDQTNRRRVELMRVLCAGMTGTKGPPESRVVSEFGRRRGDVVVRLTRMGTDVPAVESAPTIKSMAEILIRKGYAVTRSRTRIRVHATPVATPMPDFACKR